MVTLPSISIILVTWNRKRDVEVALRSIARQEYAGSIEVVVVDNGSTDGTAELLRSAVLGPLVLYAAGANLGASAARNIGLRLATGDLIAFMDSDAELLAPNTLERLGRQLIANATLAGIAPAIHRDAEARDIWLLGGYLHKGEWADMPRMANDWREPHFLSTCFSLWRREPLLKSGGFDPAYPYGYEDADLALRIRDQGYELAVDPELSVQHHISAQGRVRPWETWRHRAYTERSRNRLGITRLGLMPWLRQTVWLWTREGRRFRGAIFTGTGLSRWKIAWLMAWHPAKTLLTWPWLKLREARRPNWIQSSPLDAQRLEKITPGT